MIRGTSIHYQRIERLWRDVFCKVVEKYYNIFHHMENHRVLDINDMHMFALHHTFAARIQLDLSVWRRGHNNHPIRTEHHNTPLLLWYSGSLQHMHANTTSMNNLFRRNISEVGMQIRNFTTARNMPEQS